MKSRLLVAAVGVPLLLVILLVCPAIVTALTLSFLCAVGAREMLKTTGILDHARMIGYSMLFAFLVPIWSYFGSPLLPFVIGIAGGGVLRVRSSTDGEDLINNKDFRLKEGSYCETKADSHTRRETLYRSVKITLDASKINYLIKF